jgi:hypothetical protein
VSADPPGSSDARPETPATTPAAVAITPTISIAALGRVRSTSNDARSVTVS